MSALVSLLSAIAGAAVMLATIRRRRARHDAPPARPSLANEPETDWTRYAPDAADRLWQAVVADLMAERLEAELCGGTVARYRDNRYGWLN